MSPWKSARDALLRFLAPRLAWSYLRFVGFTSRVSWHGREHWDGLRREGRNWVYALWHGRQAFFTYTHRGHGAAVMVSRSKDGEIISEVMRLSGLRAVRGSSSRGGPAALRELVEAGRAGVPLGMTPDGPRGPLRRVQPGVLFLARELGIPILPIANGMRHKLLVGRWDEFHVPLPFNRIAVVIGTPVEVRAEDDLDAKAEELRQALDRVSDEADRIANGEN